VEGDQISLTGRASFASGSRYGDWAACLFALEPENRQQGEKPVMRFTIVRTDALRVSVDLTWFSMNLRASATDHINYENVTVPRALLRPFRFDCR
jgi:alkylation response protein AidB-like acyl-CoA dehydrogenase